MQHGITKYLRRTGAVLSDVQDLQLPLQIPKTAGFVVIRRESARQDRAGRTRRGVAALHYVGFSVDRASQLELQVAKRALHRFLQEV